MIHALLVEDDPTLGRAFGRRLSRHLDVVAVVADAEAALRRIELGSVDVVITDYDLGQGLTGVDLARRIRAQWPGVVVILASGSLDDRMREAASVDGIHACFMKPVPVDELIATIQDALGTKTTPH